MTKRSTKRERVEMTNARGNIARPWPEEVPAWAAAGWTVVQRNDAGTADPNPKGTDE